MSDQKLLAIALPAESVTALVDHFKKQDPAFNDAQLDDALRIHVNSLVNSVLGGGVVLEKTVVDRIAGVIPDGTGFDIEAAIHLMQKGAGKDGDRIVLRWTVDPAYIAPLRDRAERMSMSMERVLQMTIDRIMSAGMIYSIEPEDVHRVLFDNSQYRKLCDLLGTDKPVGEDIVKMLEAAETPVFMQ